MDNTEKLRNLFVDALGIDEKIVDDVLDYNSIAEWDSVAHMRLIAAIETTFDIMVDTEDIIDISSFKKAKEIITKYGVEFKDVAR